MAQVADALQAAHDADVIHRDVKPGNILVANRPTTNCDVTSASGAPETQPPALSTLPGDGRQVLAKLTDFGIGQVLSEEVLRGVTKAGFTQTLVADSSSQTGSQMYMAPELLAGKPASIRSDIYSLGVVLYQLLCGDLTRPLTTDWARHIPDPLLREDLQHCFAGNPQERFSGAGQLAKNLRDLPRRQAALAQEQAMVAAREKAAYRRGVALTAALAGAVVAMLAALAIFTWTQWHNSRATARALRINSYAADMKVVGVALAENNRKRALELLRKYVPGPEASFAADEDLRGIEWRLLWARAQGEEIETLLQSERRMKDAIFSPPDGKLIATFAHDGAIQVLDWGVKRTGATLALAGGDHTIRLLEVSTHRMMATLRGHLAEVWKVGYSPDGRYLLSASKDGSVKLWNAQPKADEANSWKALSGQADGHLVHNCGMMASFTNGQMQFWSLVKGKPARSFALNIDREELDGRLRCSPDGELAALGKSSGDVEFYDCATGHLTGTLKAGEKLASPLAISPDRKHVVLRQDTRLEVWSIQSGRRVVELPESDPSQAQFSPDGRLVAYIGPRYTVKLWDLAVAREACVPMRGHAWVISQINFSPDGKLLLSTSIDDDVRLWDARTGRPFGHPLKGHTQGLRWGQFSPDGRTVLTCDQRSVRLWNVGSGQEVICFLDAGDFLLSADGTTLVLAGRTLQLLEIPLLSEIDARQRRLNPPR